MKASVELLSAAPASEKSRVAVFAELFKARLTSLVLLTTLVGFYAGCDRGMDLPLLLPTLLGVGLLAAGAAALNQLIERNLDARMRRTEDRPLPSGRLQPDVVLFVGIGASLLGMICLASLVNVLTCVLGAATLLTYLFVYTPLKRLTPLNTVVGAVPGALPPLLGWTAARGELAAGGWSLFAILFFWQLPHFLAIAWLYRDDYARAGFAMLPAVDATGERTGRHAVWHTMALLAASVFPLVFGLTGGVYLAGAVGLGAAFLFCVVRFARRLTEASARLLFLASILYLPLLLALIVVDKIRAIN